MHKLHHFCVHWGEWLADCKLFLPQICALLFQLKHTLFQFHDNMLCYGIFIVLMSHILTNRTYGLLCHLSKINEIDLLEKRIKWSIEFTNYFIIPISLLFIYGIVDIFQLI